MYMGLCEVIQLFNVYLCGADGGMYCFGGGQIEYNYEEQRKIDESQYRHVSIKFLFELN